MHIKRAMVNAKCALTPSFVKTTITTPLNAKTDPTDRSNSPDTIRIVAPIAIKAISGEIVKRTRRFLKFKKFSLIKKKVIAIMINIVNAANSGLDATYLKDFLMFI